MQPPLRWLYQSAAGQRFITSPLGRAVKQALPARLAIAAQFYHHHGYFPNLRTPTTHSEKIQYRKLYDRDPRLPPLIDKVTAKEIIAGLIGADWIIPTLWSGTDPAQIPFDDLTPPYVVKASHGCQCNLFVFDASDVDKARIQAQAEAWLRLDYSRRYHEWAYSQVPRRLLIESFIGDDKTLPVDFKFLVFGGNTHLVRVIRGRGTDDRCDVYFDTAWTFQPALTKGPLEQWGMPAPPKHLAEMIKAAETLAAPFGFARVDFYEVDDRPLFGEIAFYPDSGYLITPLDYDRMLGSLWPS